MLQAINGEEGTLALPSCNPGGPAILFLFVRDAGSVLIAGSRLPGNVGNGCS
jgi:hypothetical protein